MPLPADAQDFSRRSRRQPRVEESAGVFPYDGQLTFARVRFEMNNVFGGWGGGMPAWAHDYPYAERNFAMILRDISTARPYTGGSRIVAFDDPELFKYPIAYVSEPGFWAATEREVEAVRAYLLKGGFLIFDDFDGRDWFNFEEVMKRVIPGARFLPMDVSHPIFHAFFEIERLELRNPQSGRPGEFYGLFVDNDPSKRMLAMVNYNTDIGDYMEWSPTGFVPVDLSNEAYKLAVNYWLYALTH